MQQQPQEQLTQEETTSEQCFLSEEVTLIESSTSSDVVIPSDTSADSAHEPEEDEQQPPQLKRRKLELTICQVCNTETSKYTCPGCRIHYCSLSCCTKHKTDTSCTGKRDKTAFVALENFSDRHLVSDYHFLEEAKLKKFSSRRSRIVSHIDSHEFQYHPPHVKFLQQKAGQKGILLSVMPEGMAKRKQNTTRYMNKENKFHWHVMLHFDQVLVPLESDDHSNVASDVALSLTQTGVVEDTLLFDIVRKVLDRDVEGNDPIVRNRLEKYVFWYEQAIRNQPEWLSLKPVPSVLPPRKINATATTHVTKEQELESVSVDNGAPQSSNLTQSSKNEEESKLTPSEIHVDDQNSAATVATTLEQSQEEDINSSDSKKDEETASDIILSPLANPDLPLDQTPFCIFIRVSELPSNQIAYHRLDLTKTLQQNLIDKVVIEYPELHISLPSYAHEYPVVTEQQLTEMKQKREEKNEMRKKRKEEYEQKQAARLKYQQQHQEQQQQASSDNQSSSGSGVGGGYQSTRGSYRGGGGRGRGGRGNFRGGARGGRGGGYRQHHH